MIHSSIKEREKDDTLLSNAYSYLYRRSKKFRIVDLFFVWVSFVFPLIVFFGVDDIYKYYVAVFGIAWVSFDFIFEYFYKGYQKKAVNIHEQFDCYVYNLEWNEDVAGEKISEPDIIKYNKKNKQKDIYSSKITDDFPESIRPLLAMRENLYFEKENRNVFNNIVIILLFTFYSGLFIFALTKDGLFADVFVAAYLVPTFSFLKHYFTLFTKNQKLLNTQIQAYKKTNSFLNDYDEKHKEPENAALRNIQNIIFGYRKENAGIPLWLYNLRKKKLNKYIEEANKRYKAKSSKLSENET